MAPTRIPDEADDATRALLEWVAEADLPPLHGMGAQEARRAFDERRERVDLDPVPVARVEDRVLEAPGRAIPIRVYEPRRGGGARPLLVYFHGGGFVIGNLDSHDSLCRRLTEGAGCVTVSVDYRLAPEHRFPAAAEDAAAALERVAEKAAALGGDGGRIAVAGDSAGGTLAAVAAQHARDRGAPGLRAQVLVYPAVDPVGRHESTVAFADIFPIDKPMMDWFYRHYFGGGPPPTTRGRRRGGSPTCRASRRRRFSPPASTPCVTRGPPMRGVLRDAGVPVDYECYEGTVHGFLGMGKALPHAERAIERVCAALRAAFA